MWDSRRHTCMVRRRSTGRLCWSGVGRQRRMDVERHRARQLGKDMARAALELAELVAFMEAVAAVDSILGTGQVQFTDHNRVCGKLAGSEAVGRQNANLAF